MLRRALLPAVIVGLDGPATALVQAVVARFGVCVSDVCMCMCMCMCMFVCTNCACVLCVSSRVPPPPPPPVRLQRSAPVPETKFKRSLRAINCALLPLVAPTVHLWEKWQWGVLFAVGAALVAVQVSAVAVAWREVHGERARGLRRLGCTGGGGKA
jgi:hypothetical protein